ncbi:guanine nucleotide-binding protein alpha-1 subunit-like [Vicia villosa]|uniref:guanine nucleotide-binding protein alpha-1 subunit-like n=1 Tax=Vicia villosa TaxID=3911 RepID=UPI00273BBB5C|nr:guanine nucleotide-binding protein alpha-1 subunit-like [Vicia villosa]
MQIKLLFQTGFDEVELKSYLPVVHVNVYQTIKLPHDGSKEFAQNDVDFLKYVISSENKDIGEKLSEIGGRLNYPRLTKELAHEIESPWKDAAIQITFELIVKAVRIELYFFYIIKKAMFLQISSKMCTSFVLSNQ